jgi:hypothetical protein
MKGLIGVEAQPRRNSFFLGVAAAAWPLLRSIGLRPLPGCEARIVEFCSTLRASATAVPGAPATACRAKWEIECMEFSSPESRGAPPAIVNNNPFTMLFGGETAEVENCSTLRTVAHERARRGFPPGRNS